MPETKRWQVHEGALLDSVKGFDVIDCRACGFKHIVPIPTPAELEAVYRQEYYTLEKPLYLERYREDLDWWNLTYSGRYDILEELLPLERRRILDVGSGPGFFLLQGKQRGWQTLGMEPSLQAAAHSRGLGLEVVEDFLNEQSAQRLGVFDVVHLHEVLEHVPDPGDTLRLVYQLLAPGGLLCVIVPNDYNPLQKIVRDGLGYEPWWVAPPHHLNYFDAASLARLVEKAGFRVLHETSTFPMEVFLLMGEDYVRNDSTGRRMHGMRKALELHMAHAQARGLLEEFYAALASRGMGRECVLIAARQ